MQERRIFHNLPLLPMNDSSLPPFCFGRVGVFLCLVKSKASAHLNPPLPFRQDEKFLNNPWDFSQGRFPDGIPGERILVGGWY